MSEMVERVARAISGGDDPANVLEIHRHRAKLAIEAMREPTEAMVDAGRNEPVSHSWGSGGEFITDPDEVWQAMIDAALL